MKRFPAAICIGLFACVSLTIFGCGSSQTTASSTAPAEQADDHDHGDHDHGDHDHGDHDHGDHDHGDHDHGDHDHGDHDHGDHDHADHDQDSGEHTAHETFAEAVNEIDKLRGSIQQALKAGDTEKADGPVHQLGHILESLPALAKKQSISDETSVEQAVDQLFKSFGAVDDRLHKGETAGKSYDEVADEIDEAIKKLRSFIKQDDPS